jgi:hypothetical protein
MHHFTFAMLIQLFAERFPICAIVGDNDACVPYIGSQAWTSELAANNGWSVAQPWSPWLVNAQVAGYATVYTDTTGEDFTFATVYNAGHMVRSSGHNIITYYVWNIWHFQCMNSVLPVTYMFTEQVPEDKPAEALALFKRVTYPSQVGVVWNPAPATPLHISSTTNVMDGQAEATVGPAKFPAHPASQLTVHLGEAFTLRVAVAGGYLVDDTAPHLYLFEWEKDGLSIAADGAPTLKIASLAECDVGIYTCTVSTLDGEVVASQPVSLVAAPALNATQVMPDTGYDLAAASAALPAGIGLLVGVAIGCIGGRNCCGPKRTEATMKGYKAMPTDEE